jgi:hypothetical protein
MKLPALAFAGLLALAAIAAAQETKPVPKGSARVTVSGCSKGYVFTAGPRTVEAPGSGDIREGTRLRMNGPKKLMTEIKAHEGARIEVTGLMKQGQNGPSGVGIGGGVRIAPGPNPQSGTVSMGAPAGLPAIDVENWRLVPGDCPAR